MPNKGSKRLIRHAQIIHAKVSSLLVEQTRLAPADVHQLRLSVKQLRALWQLLKPFLSGRQAAAASRDIGRAAALLANARDQHVRIKTLDKWIRKAAEEDLPALRQVQKQLIAQQTGSPKQVLMTADIVSRFAQDREHWRGLKLACSRRELICKGHGRLYRKASRRFCQAAGRGKAEDWHRLRRLTKYMALALPVVAGDDSGNTEAKRYADLAAQLGDLHDLHVMAGSLRALPNQDEPLIRQAIALVERRADALQNKCQNKSKRLFRANPESKGAGSNF